MKSLLSEDDKDGSKLEHYPECLKKDSSGNSRNPRILNLGGGGNRIQITAKGGLLWVFLNGTAMAGQEDFVFENQKYPKKTKFTWHCNTGIFKINKESSPSTSNLPDWAKTGCLNDDFGEIIPVKPFDENQVAYINDGTVYYFWKNNEFLLRYENGNEHRGKWGCINGKIRIDLPETDLYYGKYFTMAEGWVRITPEEEEDPIPAPTEDCKPFDNRDQADKFRIWVNDNLPDIAKNIPGLNSRIRDKKLDTTGKCNNTHIKTAANHKIDGKTLLDIFTSGVDITKIQQEKNDREEVYNWWETQKKEGKVNGGKLFLFPPESSYRKYHYAYGKEDKNDNNLVYLYLKDGTWFSYYKGKGYQEEGKWQPDLVLKEPELVVGESKNISLIKNLKKLINEQIIVPSETKKHSLYKPENSSNLSVKDNEQKIDNGSKPNVIFDEKVETEKVMTPIQTKALNVLDNWLKYNNNTTSFGILRKKVKDDITTSINDGKTTIGNYSPSQFCSASVSEKLKKSKKEIEDKERTYGFALTNEDKSFISQLKSLFNQVESECKKISERRQKPLPDQNVDNKQKNDQNLKSDNLNSDTPKEMSQIQKDTITKLVDAGYEKIENCKSFDSDRLIEKINLKEKYPNIFSDDVCYVKYRELSQDSWNTFLTDSSDSGFSALTKSTQGDKGKENCRTVISNTYDAQKNNLLTNNKFILKNVKNFIVNDCHRLYKDKFGRRTNNKLSWLVYNSAAFSQLNESTIKKNMKNTLNNNIKKHLKESIEVKKIRLVENRIIKSRLELTTSNSSNIKRTVKGMIRESIKMSAAGMDDNLIKENLMDLIDVLYKDHSAKVKKVFNQESAKYISDKIGLSDDSFLRRTINDVFSKSDKIDASIDLFNDCEYLCKTISDEVSKTLGFTDKTVEEIFSKNMKPEFRDMICTNIKSIGNSMQDKYSKMKSKALDKS